MANACEMIRVCMERQQGDALYVFTENLGARGFEMGETPVEAVPSDQGIEGHATFAMEEVSA